MVLHSTKKKKDEIHLVPIVGTYEDGLIGINYWKKQTKTPFHTIPFKLEGIIVQEVTIEELWFEQQNNIYRPLIPQKRIY